MNIDKEIHLFLQKLDLKNKNIVVGYSAGADSTILLHILNQKKEHFGFNLEAVFFSHNGSPINDGEDKNLALAKKMCLDRNIKLHDIQLNLVKSSQKSWEQLGRTERLKYYKSTNFDMIFLGHHKDDQNETTMTQIFRGGGKGSSGMKPVDGKFYRPMLNISKAEIYSYLTVNNVPWIEDPTNVNSDFTRNFWRNIGLPAISEHYPNYSDLLENFRVKNKNLNLIAFDLAKIDGLNNFLLNEEISIKNLPDYRIQNLLSQSFSILGNSIESKKLDNLLKQSKNKESFLNFGNYSLMMNKDKLKLSHLEFNNTIKNKP